MKEILFPDNESTRKFCEAFLKTIQELNDELDGLIKQYGDAANTDPATEDEVVVRDQIMDQLLGEMLITIKKINILNCHYANCMGNYVNN